MRTADGGAEGAGRRPRAAPERGLGPEEAAAAAAAALRGRTREEAEVTTPGGRR